MAGVAWSQDRWIPAEQATIALDDIGFLQGAVIVDRLRTCHGKPLDAGLHIRRLLTNCLEVGIELPAALDLEFVIDECATRNRSSFEGDDFSIVTLITPGRLGRDSAGPTVVVHATPIAWSRLADWYARGQTLIIGSHRNVPAACWPPTIKTRARLQYYLADRQAALQPGVDNGMHVGAILLDLQDNLTDTSAANVLIVERGRKLVSPPMESVLNGISLARTLRLAEQAGLQIHFEPIPIPRALAADEILLCGSTGLLWAARSFADREFPHAVTGAVLQSLQHLWMEEIGLDYIQQAMNAVQASPASDP